MGIANPLKNNTSGQRENRVSRRTFLGGAAAATVLTVVPKHVLGGQGHTPPADHAGRDRRGRPGSQNTATTCSSRGQVVAVCDVVRSRRLRGWVQGKERRTAGRPCAHGRRILRQKARQYRGAVDYRELLAKKTWMP